MFDAMQNARKIRSELPGKLSVRIFYFEYTEKYSYVPAWIAVRITNGMAINLAK